MCIWVAKCTFATSRILAYKLLESTFYHFRTFNLLSCSVLYWIGVVLSYFVNFLFFFRVHMRPGSMKKSRKATKGRFTTRCCCWARMQCTEVLFLMLWELMTGNAHFASGNSTSGFVDYGESSRPLVSRVTWTVKLTTCDCGVSRHFSVLFLARCQNKRLFLLMLCCKGIYIL